jgi:hypothetical protein
LRGSCDPTPPTGRRRQKQSNHDELSERRWKCSLPDQQISLTDLDARSMATSGCGSGVVGHNIAATSSAAKDAGGD